MHHDMYYQGDISKPVFLTKTKQLLSYIQTIPVTTLQKMLVTNSKIAKETYDIYQKMDLYHKVTPAILCFDGIQYTYMGPKIFEEQYNQYVQEHVLILSGFYGVLRPFDGVTPYRLELNTPFMTPFCKSLYDFWKDSLYQEVIRKENLIIDLASKQYSRSITKYKSQEVRIVKCYFMEKEENRCVEKGVYVKMARGEMIRYLASVQASSVEEVKQFKALGYRYCKNLSDEGKIVFIREKERNEEI